jgi:hypothetical protein
MLSNSDKIMSSLNKFFEDNENYSRKELLEYAKKAYDDNYKKSKKVVDENAEKKPLNSYQLYMKEQRVILNKRENERTDGEKKKSTELMKEIAEMWKVQKTRIEKKEDNNKPKKNNNKAIKDVDNNKAIEDVDNNKAIEDVDNKAIEDVDNKAIKDVDNKAIEDVDNLNKRELKKFIKMKEMFKDDNKPNEKEIKVENDDEENEAQIINKKKEIFSNNIIEEVNKEEDNDKDDGIMNRLNKSIKKDKWTRL